MRRTLSAMVAAAFFAATVDAGEIAAKWKKEGNGYVTENRLPPGATVKVRVKSLDDNKTPQEFTVNGEKNTAQNLGDEFRAKVDGNGKVTFGWGFGPNQEDAAVVPLEGGGGTDLRFGHYKVSGVSRWKLVINVQIVD